MKNEIEKIKELAELGRRDKTIQAMRGSFHLIIMTANEILKEMDEEASRIIDLLDDDEPLCDECGAETERTGTFRANLGSKTYNVCGVCLPLFR